MLFANVAIRTADDRSPRCQYPTGHDSIRFSARALAYEIMNELKNDSIATRNAHEPDGWIALHYPEEIIVDVGAALNRPQQLQKYLLDKSTPYPVYCNNLEVIR